MQPGAISMHAGAISMQFDDHLEGREHVVRLQTDDVRHVEGHMRHWPCLLMPRHRNGLHQVVRRLTHNVRGQREGHLHELEPNVEGNLEWEIGKVARARVQWHHAVARRMPVLKEEVGSATLRDQELIDRRELGGQMGCQLAERDAPLADGLQISFALHFIANRHGVLGAEYLPHSRPDRWRSERRCKEVSTWNSQAHASGKH